MGIMKMNMSQGDIVRDASLVEEYNDEIMFSGWNPVIGMSQLIAEKQHKTFPADLATVDMAAFVKNMRA